MKATHAGPGHLSISHQLAERAVNEKRKQNQHAPISRLFPEIFSITFCHVRDSFIGTPPYDWGWARRQAKRWIGLTYVCHAWRDIAINSPTLWTTIFVSVEDQLEWVQEMLRRSKQCPLSVLIESSSSPRALSSAGPILHELKNHMQRFRELSLRIPNVDVHDFFSNSQTLRLEHLHISIPSQDTETSSSESSETALGTFVLSDSNATVLCIDSLRHLRIGGCGIDFHAAFLHSLIHLRLFNIDEDCKLPCSDFIAVLANIPTLEILDLEGFLKEDEIDDVEEYVAIRNKTHLHRIQYLSLSCCTGEMAQFLFSLVLPPSCKLRLNIRDEDVAIAPGFPLICAWLSRHFQPPPSSHEGEDSFQNYFRSVLLEDNMGDYKLAVTGFYEVIESGPLPVSEKISDGALLSVSVLWYPPEEPSESDDFWRLFLKSLPLSNIVSLGVYDDSVTLPDSVWVEVFATVTTLKNVIIDSNDYAAFFDIASPNSIALPFPALSCVTVQAPCVKDRDYPSIDSCLDSRLEAGLPPFKLVLYTNDIQPRAITWIRESALNIQIHRY